MKMSTPVTTAIDRILELKGRTFHRYHSFKMTMLTCSHTVFNFKVQDSSHGTYVLLLEDCILNAFLTYCCVGVPLCTVKHLELEAVESMWPCFQRADLSASILAKTMQTLKRWHPILSNCCSTVELHYDSCIISCIVCKL